MNKLTLTCTNFRPFAKNTLVGFAEIFVEDLQLTIRDISVHTKNASRWAALPAKPMMNRDGSPLRDPTTGKPQYVSILQFASRPVADAFSAAAIEAVLKHSPNAFSAPATSTAAAEVPF
jgi:hypothetical protein